MLGFLKRTWNDGIFGGPAPFLTQRGADRAMMDDAFDRGLRNYQRGPMPQLERPADVPPPINLMPTDPRRLPVWQAANRRYGEQQVPPVTQRMNFPGLSPAMGGPMTPQMDAEPMQRRVPQFDYGDGTTGTDMTNLNVVSDLGGGAMPAPAPPMPEGATGGSYFVQPPQPYAPLRDPRVQDLFLQSLAQSIAGGAQGRAGIGGAINKAQRRIDMEGRWAGLGSIMQGLDSFKGKKGKGKGQWDEFVKARQAGANNNVLNQINMANQNNAVNQKQMFDMLYSLDPENAKRINADAAMRRALTGQSMVPIRQQDVDQRGQYQQGQLQHYNRQDELRGRALDLRDQYQQEAFRHWQNGDQVAAERAAAAAKNIDSLIGYRGEMVQQGQERLGQGQQRIDNQQVYQQGLLGQGQQRIDNQRDYNLGMLGLGQQRVDQGARRLDQGDRGLDQREYNDAMKYYFKGQDVIKTKNSAGAETVQQKYPGAGIVQPLRPGQKVQVPQAALDFYENAKPEDKAKLRQQFMNKYQVTPEQAAYYGKRR